ncbi:MAG: 50S ribosomal protein L11 methyltransferase [Chloroflexota bacterium]|nr:50S ribosomal protein L11 methyltransferase [Chloroflexota bacterium]
MNWLELSVDVDQEAVEPVSELFARHGYNGGVVVEQPLVVPEGEHGDWAALVQPEIDPTRPVSVRTYLPDDADAAEKRRKVEEALWHLGRMRQVGTLQVRECREEDWANAWKAYYGIQRMGERIVIKPSWLEYTPREDDVVLDLDPGMAFGTGLHPTTRLCLAALEEFVRPDMNILDLGTGSGILAIAAAKLGGPGVRLVAVDTDNIAVEATRENVERNGLATQIRVEGGSTGAAQQARPYDLPYDLVVANILASVIIELAKPIHALVKPGGMLLSSGIFIDRGESVVEALEKIGLPVRERRQEGDWLCLVSVRER